MTKKQYVTYKPFEIHLKNLNTPWNEVRSLATRCLFPKNHMEPGENVRGLYFVTRGTVRLCYIGAAGQERTSLFLGVNCLFNEIPSITHSVEHAAFFCVEDVEAWRFDGQIVHNHGFISQYPHLIENLLHSMAKKSSIFFSHISSMAFASSMSQLCAMLLQLAKKDSPRMTQGEVAATLGLHITTVARMLRTLREQGIIGKFTKTDLQILDIDALCKLAYA